MDAPSGGKSFTDAVQAGSEANQPVLTAQNLAALPFEVAADFIDGAAAKNSIL